jgi:hypothetical protein
VPAKPASSLREDNEVVIDKAELRRMSPAERRELTALLTEFDGFAALPGPAAPDGSAAPGEVADSCDPAALRPDPYRIDPTLRRERRLALLVSAACCVILAGWIVLLAATLPHHFDAHHWRAVWVNFDVFLLAAFAASAWAIWRQRQVLILLLVLIGTMLCCDAWFDVGTSLATSGFTISVLTAVFAELPLAFLAFAGARRLLRATVAASILAGARAQLGQAAQAGPAGAGLRAPDWARVGNWGRTCAGQSLRRAPLAGAGLDEALPLSRADRQAERAGRSRQSA